VDIFIINSDEVSLLLEIEIAVVSSCFGRVEMVMVAVTAAAHVQAAAKVEAQGRPIGVAVAEPY
jgi:hypothetical protein